MKGTGGFTRQSEVAEKNRKSLQPEYLARAHHDVQTQTGPLEKHKAGFQGLAEVVHSPSDHLSSSGFHNSGGILTARGQRSSHGMTILAPAGGAALAPSWGNCSCLGEGGPGASVRLCLSWNPGDHRVRTGAGGFQLSLQRGPEIKVVENGN